MFTFLRLINSTCVINIKYNINKPRVIPYSVG